MARSSLNAISILSDTSCNSPRTDEAAKWNSVKDSLKSIGQKGQVVSSAWGHMPSERTVPIIGASMLPGTGSFPNLDYVMQIMFGERTYEARFEQPSFQTVGASSSPDKFVLNIRFAISDFLAPEFNVLSYNADLGGKIVVTLQNAGGTHQLYAAENHRLASGQVGAELIAPVSNSEYTVYDRVITGQLPAGLVPPSSQTYDSKILIKVSDIWFNYAGTPVQGEIFPVDNLTDPAAYIGVFGYTLRLYNDG